MAHDAVASLVAALANAPGDQAHLKQIKNALIGHNHRKEAAVRAGLITLLLSIIADHSVAEERALVDAITIIGTLATAGPQIAAPLVAAESHIHLLKLITQDYSDAVRTAALVALRNISAIALPGKDILQAELITPQSVLHFKDLLLTSSQTSKLFSLTLGIIHNAANNNTTRNLLLEYEVIDVLAVLLVAWTVQQAQLGYQGDTNGLLNVPCDATVPLILNALNAILGDSCYRTEYFMHLPPVGNVCVSLGSGDQTRHALSSMTAVLPELLPSTSTPQKGTPLHPGLSMFNKFVSATQPPARQIREDGDAAHANAVISWLILIARSLRGAARLSALTLVALVEHAIRAAQTTVSCVPDVIKTRERERQLAQLAAPLAVQQMQEAWKECQRTTFDGHADSLALLSRSCRTLAALISPSRDSQQAAVESSAIKTVCSALKMCFKPISLSKPIWTPRPTGLEDEQCKLGDSGLPSEVLLVMGARASVLYAVQAIAAISDKDDMHRRQLIDINIVPHIIEALRPLSEASLTPSTRTIEGNTYEVVLAALRAIQAMSRSVAILRTSLIDAGVVKPVFELLQHNDPDIQLAATDVCANLCVDSSPMRGDLVDMGAVKIFSDHCKNGPEALTVASLWALKHAVMAWPGPRRIAMFNELGAEWLMTAIQGQHHELHNGGSNNGGVALNSANAAGEQVDLLNPSSMDVDGPLHPEVTDEYYDDDGELLYDEASNTHYHDSSLRSTLHNTSSFDTQRFLAVLKSAEEDPSCQVRQNDITIQEQALDFIRNFLSGTECTPMVNYLFQQIDSQRLLDLLLSKLIGPGRRTRTGPPIKPVPETVLSSMHVINHIVNGNTSHKETVIRQRGILDALVPQLSHPDPRIRLVGVWVVVSLTWMEDGNDRYSARARGSTLRQTSIETAVRNLVNDPELDIRERAKTAVRQFEAL